MSDAQRLIQREIRSRDAIRIVTVIGDLRMKEMSEGNAAPVFVTDIEFGSGRPMKNVPVKSLGGSMFYAQRGQTVQIRRGTLGRWQVIGPGDRANGIEHKRIYNIGTQAQVGSTVDTGFTFRREPFEFYLGPQAMKGNPTVTFANTGGDDTATRDDGSWIDDGFEVGDSVTFQGTVDNDYDAASPLTVSARTDLVLSFAGDPFVDEVAPSGIGIGVVGTALWNNGGSYPGFPETTVVDADGGLA